MTQAFNLAQLANNLNTSGQLDGTDGLSGLVANANLASSGTASSSTYLRGDRSWASLPSFGKVLQVISFAKSDTFSTSSLAYVAIPGLSATITPSNAANKILIMVNLCYSSSPGLTWAAITRNGSLIAVGDSAGSRPQSTLPSISGQGNNSDRAGSASMTYLDTAGTTSPITYALNIANETGNCFVNRTANDSDTQYSARSISSITLMELNYA